MRMKTMVILASTLDEEAIVESVNERAVSNAPEFSTANNVLQLIGLVLLLIVILAAAYYTSKFLGKLKLGQLKSSNFNVIDSYQISPNKMLQIVKIANKYVVISVSKDNISFITELDEAQVLLKDTNIGEKQNFKQIFNKLIHNMKE